jgi:aldehyde dehydrogenase (NAD+)
LALTRCEPLGVVAAITPWNSPLRLLLWKLAPALAAGNTLVVKPSEVSPISTLMLAELAIEAGLPAGVFSVVTGSGVDVAQPLTKHRKVAKLAFTGGGGHGRQVNLAAAERFCPVTLELGGKSPNIIFEDCDVEAAIAGAAAAIFGSSGQTCLAGSRLLVHERVYNDIVQGLVAIARSVRYGDPMDETTEYGPIPVKAQYDAILKHVEDARLEGAKVAYGAHPLTGRGCAAGLFIAPTVLVDVTPNMRVWREELFGPVVCVMPFSTEDEACHIANDTRYGLAAGVWTNDLNRAFRVSARLQAGVVWVNGYRITSPTMPFGGYKESGLGREGGMEMIREYLQIKSICINMSGEVKTPFKSRGAPNAN